MVANIPEFNVLLISWSMQFWFVTVVPKYWQFHGQEISFRLASEFIAVI